MLEINLKTFEFNNEWYLQIKGTAMGKKFAPSYANIYVDCETTGLEKCSKKPTQYLRFLDDIWGIWDHSEEDLKDFIETQNNHHRSIKLKYELQD